MRINTMLILFISLFFAIIFADKANAVAIGASPATLYFKIPEGGYEEQKFQVGTNSESDLQFDLKVGNSLTNIITLTQTKSKTNIKQAAEITVKASANNLKPGIYSGAITVSSGYSESTGSKVSSGVAVKINVEITSEEPLEEAPLPKSPTGNAVAKISSSMTRADWIGIIIITIILVVVTATYIFLKRKI